MNLINCPGCKKGIWIQGDEDSIECPLCGKRLRIQRRQVTIRSSSQRECPFCGELIQKSATKCRYCGEWLTGKNRAPRSFADEYGFRFATPKRVEKPGSVTFAVFLMFVQLVGGWLYSLFSPEYAAMLAAMGTDSTFAMTVGGITSFVIAMIAIGINTGHGWCRMLFLILTGIALPFWIIGFVMALASGHPISIWQTATTVMSIIEFFLLAGSAAGNWYRAIANGQKR